LRSLTLDDGDMATSEDEKRKSGVSETDKSLPSSSNEDGDLSLNSDVSRTSELLGGGGQIEKSASVAEKCCASCLALRDNERGSQRESLMESLRQLAAVSTNGVRLCGVTPCLVSLADVAL